MVYVSQLVCQWTFRLAFFVCLRIYAFKNKVCWNVGEYKAIVFGMIVKGVGNISHDEQ